MTGALKGVRVLDLSRVWSGPYAGRNLAGLGAEVIHITGRITVTFAEVTPETAKIIGIFPDNIPGEKPWNRASSSNDFHRGKLGLTLELNTDKGLEIIKELIKVSDVLLENYSPRVMPNFGLDYPNLKKINPNIILCSMPGYGANGPYRDWVSYGTNLDPATGLASLMGYPGEEAHMSGNAYPDPAAGVHAVAAILTALVSREMTGMGQYIDLSQAESTTSLIGEAILGYSLNGKTPVRRGNRHPVHAPCGCYPCAGNDKWVTVQVENDNQWQGLLETLGHPAELADKSLAEEKDRMDAHDKIDRVISSWTEDKDQLQAMKSLQAHGVPSGAVLDGAGLAHDEQLCDQGFFVKVDHPEVGLKKHPRLPIRMSLTPTIDNIPAPTLGQHNEYVLKNILGYSDEKIAALKEEGHIGEIPLG